MTDPTRSTELSDRAAALVSYAQTPPPLPDAPPQVTVSAATVCAGAQVRVAVLTTPLTQVHLTTGAGVFASGTGGITVTTDEFGAADATLTATNVGAGQFQVTVTGGELVVTQRAAGTGPQNLAWFDPHTYTTTTAVTVTDCTTPVQAPPPPATPQPTPAPDTLPVTVQTLPVQRIVPKPATQQATAVPFGQPAPIPVNALSLRKVGPRRLRARQAAYTLTVTNTGTTTVTAVAVTDRIPAKLHLTRIPRGARFTAGTVVITVARLAPGEHKTVRLVMATDTTGTGCLTNRATATAVDTPLVRAQARTCITAAPRPAPVPVTG